MGHMTPYEVGRYTAIKTAGPLPSKFYSGLGKLLSNRAASAAVGGLGGAALGGAAGAYGADPGQRVRGALRGGAVGGAAGGIGGLVAPGKPVGENSLGLRASRVADRGFHLHTAERLVRSGADPTVEAAMKFLAGGHPETIAQGVRAAREVGGLAALGTAGAVGGGFAAGTTARNPPSMLERLKAKLGL